MVKKVNKAGKIRSYVSAHPDAKPAQIAKALNMSVQYVYQVMYKVKSTGLPEVKDTVTQITPERMKKLVHTKEYRRHPITGKALMQGADIVATHHTDPVNHPAHYIVGGVETIDFIEAKGLGYHLGNVIKYVTRADHKGQKLEDLRKAQWYLTRAIEKESKGA
jgi:hypothetical protein